jgi:hypothetical protein
MSRRIVTTAFQAAGGGEPPDDYADKIVKLIPTDVVAAWVAVVSAIKAATPGQIGETGLWVIFAVGVVMAAAWTWKRSSEPNKPKPIAQTCVSTLAFCVWAYATGGALPVWPGNLYNPLYGTLALVFFTLASGLVPMPE